MKILIIHILALTLFFPHIIKAFQLFHLPALIRRILV